MHWLICLHINCEYNLEHTKSIDVTCDLLSFLDTVHQQLGKGHWKRPVASNILGYVDGFSISGTLGFVDGLFEGTSVGAPVGLPLGGAAGNSVGVSVGFPLGLLVGGSLGACVSISVGSSLE